MPRTLDPKPVARPSWEDYWGTVGNETWLMVQELIELSPSVTAHFASYVEWHDEPCRVPDPADPYNSIPDPEGWIDREADLDWSAAAAAADQWPCSTTERYLLDLVLSLIQPDEEHTTEVRRDDDGYYEVTVTSGTRTFDMRNLGLFGSWQDEVAVILYEWMTGRRPQV